MSFSQAQTITSIIIENGFENILELGFRHGVSTCYMAAALDELHNGKITTIDLTDAREASPNIEQLLNELGLAGYVTVFYEPTSYTWRMMKMLEEDSEPRFDLCYVDGAHDWFTDGFAFFLVDRLIKPGGMIIFDDLDWTYSSSPALAKSEKVKKMPQEEKRTPQVRMVWELLVKRHPGYREFIEKDGWAYARKSMERTYPASREIRKEVVYEKEYVGLGGAILRILRRLMR